MSVVSDIIESANDTIGVSIQSITELDRQNQVLTTAHADSKIIRQDLKIADRHVSNIESFWNRIGNFFLPEPKPFEARTDFTPTPNPLLDQKLFAIPMPVDVNASTDPELDSILEASQKIKALALCMNGQLDQSDRILTRTEPVVSESNARQANLKKRVDAITKLDLLLPFQ